jgi:hypothetical protein
MPVRRRVPPVAPEGVRMMLIARLARRGPNPVGTRKADSGPGGRSFSHCQEGRRGAPGGCLPVRVVMLHNSVTMGLLSRRRQGLSTQDGDCLRVPIVP